MHHAGSMHNMIRPEKITMQAIHKLESCEACVKKRGFVILKPQTHMLTHIHKWHCQDQLSGTDTFLHQHPWTSIPFRKGQVSRH